MYGGGVDISGGGRRVDMSGRVVPLTDMARSWAGSVVALESFAFEELLEWFPVFTAQREWVNGIGKWMLSDGILIECFEGYIEMEG